MQKYITPKYFKKRIRNFDYEWLMETEMTGVFAHFIAKLGFHCVILKNYFALNKIFYRHRNKI